MNQVKEVLIPLCLSLGRKLLLMQEDLPSLHLNRTFQTLPSLLAFSKGTGLNSYQDYHRTNGAVELSSSGQPKAYAIKCSAH